MHLIKVPSFNKKKLNILLYLSRYHMQLGNAKIPGQHPLTKTSVNHSRNNSQSSGNNVQIQPNEPQNENTESKPITTHSENHATKEIVTQDENVNNNIDGNSTN